MIHRATRAPSRFPRLAASRRFALLCVGAAFAFAAEPAGAGVGRGALWRVVEVCLLNHALAGGAFPCLEVNVSAGKARGYAVLRPPLSASGLILAPTRRIAGVEDASLAAPGAPNYFEDAWRARKFLDAEREPPPHDGVVLAVIPAHRAPRTSFTSISAASPRARGGRSRPSPRPRPLAGGFRSHGRFTASNSA
ncbi:MAG TPA: CDP-diacylglycerol diphosphatase, partial [Roseiarcus sp.]|nr:CDP-diacylglycerol diphosphatase [Roseiarcus sp.]